MEVVICDTKGCDAIVKGEQTREFVKEGEGWELKITLSEGADRCAECSRKLFAKAAVGAWNELKRKTKKARKGKEIKEVDSGS